MLQLSCVTIDHLTQHTHTLHRDPQDQQTVPKFQSWTRTMMRTTHDQLCDSLHRTRHAPGGLRFLTLDCVAVSFCEAGSATKSSHQQKSPQFSYKSLQMVSEKHGLIPINAINNSLLNHLLFVKLNPIHQGVLSTSLDPLTRRLRLRFQPQRRRHRWRSTHLARKIAGVAPANRRRDEKRWDYGNLSIKHEYFSQSWIGVFGEATGEVPYESLLWLRMAKEMSWLVVYLPL